MIIDDTLECEQEAAKEALPQILTGYELHPYCASDLFSFATRQGLSLSDLTGLFCPGFMSTSAFIKNVGSGDDLLSTPLQILFRLYLRYPDTIPMPERVIASQFFDEELGGEDVIATRFRGVLFGVDRNSGYNWNRDAKPIAYVRSSMIAAKKMKQQENLAPEELLERLLDITNDTMASLNVNPMKTGSWSRKDLKKEDPLHLTLDSVRNSAVMQRGRRKSNVVQHPETDRIDLITKMKSYAENENLGS